MDTLLFCFLVTGAFASQVGNALRPDSHIKFSLLQWSLSSLLEWFRSSDFGWFPFAGMYADSAKDVKGGLSAVVKHMPEWFFLRGAEQFPLRCRGAAHIDGHADFR